MDWVKVALIGCAVSLCVSAQSALAVQEIAMARCSKPAEPVDNDDDDVSYSEEPKKEEPCRRKSAARKVLEGS